MVLNKVSFRIDKFEYSSVVINWQLQFARIIYEVTTDDGRW